MPRRYTTLLAASILLCSAVQPSGAVAQAVASRAPATAGSVSGPSASEAFERQEPQRPPAAGSSGYDSGKMVRLIQLAGVPDRVTGNIFLQLLAREGRRTAGSRPHVRDSIRTLYATGRFADIQAEVVPSGEGVTLTFTTSANFFVGAVDVEGAPTRPTPNQIVNATKFQLGELYTHDKLNRALENIRQLMQEGGFYRARVTAESTSNAETQQVDILFHVTPGSQAHVGEVKVTGSSGLTSGEVQSIAHMDGGDRVTAALVSGSLQHLRKRFQKQSRALAQVSIAQQEYHEERNAVDFTFQIDPGPVVQISAEGYHVSRSVMKKEIPVYEENAVDDDLLNEGKRNLLDYLQTRGHFDATVDIHKKSDGKTMHVWCMTSIPVRCTSWCW